MENHNGQCGYDELALDFQMAADLVIGEYKQTDLGNWVAPVSHLVRQTIELRLKALLEATIERGNSEAAKQLESHDLQKIWQEARDWMVGNWYDIKEDARFDAAERLIACLHAVDPSGDLFRFGVSKVTAFGKQKSYDRVGINLEQLSTEFELTNAFLNHWQAVPMRETIAEDLDWDSDRYFDPADYPRKVD